MLSFPFPSPNSILEYSAENQEVTHLEKEKKKRKSIWKGLPTTQPQ